MSLDSETYDREMAGQQPARVGADRPHTIETRYPHSAMPSAPHSHRNETGRPAAIPSTGRLRAALLIVFAIIALSAFAAIGWMQYQANGRTDDPQIEISAPDRSVPALADAAGRD